MSETKPVWKATDRTAKQFNGISILYGGREGGALPEHSHAELQVSVHFRGTSLQPAVASHVNLFASKQPHTGGWKTGDEIVVFLLPRDLIAETREELSKGCSFDVIPGEQIGDQVLEGLGRFVRDEFQRPETLPGLFIESIAQVATRHLLRVHAPDRIHLIPRRNFTAGELSKLESYVAENLHRGITVGQLATALKMGPALFAERLKISTGSSPWRFVQEYRLKAARALLKQRKLPIADISDQLGFADQSHFTNFFRAATGVTPKAYQARL